MNVLYHSKLHWKKLGAVQSKKWQVCLCILNLYLSDVLLSVDTFYISKRLVHCSSFRRYAGGLKSQIWHFFLYWDLHFMHAFRGFPEHHLFFHVHSAGHPNTARYIFVWLDTFWRAALLMFQSQLECWAFYFLSWACISGVLVGTLLSPLPLSWCIYPLDGFMCIFRLSHQCFWGNQSKTVHIKKARQYVHWLKKKTKLCSYYVECIFCLL